MKAVNPLAAMDTVFIRDLFFRQIRNITVPHDAPPAPICITITR